VSIVIEGNGYSLEEEWFSGLVKKCRMMLTSSVCQVELVSKNSFIHSFINPVDQDDSELGLYCYSMIRKEFVLQGECLSFTFPFFVSHITNCQ
jgi:hypothetical protein